MSTRSWLIGGMLLGIAAALAQASVDAMRTSRLGDGDYAALKAAAMARSRGFVYNTDGCDILYWPTNLPVSVENFTRRRLVHALGTRITTISYCPQSAGFGHFTCRKAGEPLTGTVTKEHNGVETARNAAQDFFDLGTDALEMASAFCRTNNLEIFVSIRRLQICPTRPILCATADQAAIRPNAGSRADRVTIDFRRLIRPLRTSPISRRIDQAAAFRLT